MKLTQITLLAAALFIAAGCNKKAGDSSAAETPSDLTISTAASKKLSEVNCLALDNKVTCDPVDGLQSPQPLENKTAELKFEQQGIAKQMTVMEAYITAVKQDLDSSAVNETDKASLRDLYTAAVGCDMELQHRLAKNRQDEINEVSFHEVFGFQCGGTYLSYVASAGSVPQTFTQYIDTTDRGADLEKAYPASGDLDLTAHLKYTKADGQVRWSSSQSVAGVKRDLQTIVLSDGEFALQTSDTAKLDMNCLRLRAFGSAQVISDEPVPSRRMRCVSESTQALEAGATQAKSQSWSTEFSSQAQGDDRDLLLSTPGNDFLVDMLGFRPKYSVEVKTIKGMMNFRVLDAASMTEVMNVKTANSVPNISFAVIDTAGNSVKVKCGEEVPEFLKGSQP